MRGTVVTFNDPFIYLVTRRWCSELEFRIDHGRVWMHRPRRWNPRRDARETEEAAAIFSAGHSPGYSAHRQQDHSYTCNDKWSLEYQLPRRAMKVARYYFFLFPPFQLFFTTIIIFYFNSRPHIFYFYLHFLFVIIHIPACLKLKTLRELLPL